MHPNDQGFNEESGGDAPPSPEPFRLSITRRGMLWNNMRSHALNEGINPDDFPANRRRLRMSFISIVKSVETFVDVTRELPEFSRTLSNEDIDRIAMRTAQVENRSTGSKIKRILCNPLGAAAIDRVAAVNCPDQLGQAAGTGPGKSTAGLLPHPKAIASQVGNPLGGVTVASRLLRTVTGQPIPCHSADSTRPEENQGENKGQALHALHLDHSSRDRTILARVSVGNEPRSIRR